MPDSVPNPSPLELDPAARAEAHAAAGDRPPVNIRVSVPLPGRRFYLAVMSGRERRGPARRGAERARHPLRTAGNVLFVVAGAMLVYLLALGTALVNAAVPGF